MNEIKNNATPNPDLDATTDKPTVHTLFPVVGVGASAGGLRALQRLLAHAPASSGMAFVIVTHLSPEHESYLPVLLQPNTSMPVIQVVEETELMPNHVYIIPPGRNLQSIDSHLHLAPLEQDRRQRAPIDHFLRTLADSHDSLAIAVILTGSGSDGALGLRRIKEVGGLTVVQDPTEAEYDSMPQAALATGDVEMVLPVAEIAERLVAYVQNKPQVSVPQDGEHLPEDVGELVQKILTQVRVYTGQDFLRYKSATILRRVRRRMQIEGFATLSDYLKYLRDHATEVRALYHDFLITVTNFFRDPEAFAYLEHEVIPQIFQGKNGREGVRVWTVGCATGEEAYSMAILLLEYASGLDYPTDIQIFASDLSEEALRQGREGFYPETIAADVSPERLERFFTKEQGGYRIRQAVRECVLFTPHSLLKDPPFSRLDLICCRNLLIYIQRDAQQEIMQLFHYALRPDGYLFLGTAETVESSEFFHEVSHKYSLYQRQTVASQQLRLPSLPLTAGHHHLSVIPTLGDFRRSSPNYGDLHNRVVERYAPPSILVNADQNIVYFAEGADRYLQQPAGEPTNQVLHRIREELHDELMAALYRAQEKDAASHSAPIPLTLEGQHRQVSLVVQPLQDPELPGFVLVFFLESAADNTAQPTRLANTPNALVRDLEAELAETKKRLQINLEEYETSQEEMRAVNEELQSMNEELRSAAEELETSKEELQSVNEELMIVNQENKNKIEELNQLTGDLHNLLSSTEIATLFLDRELRIKRFTPRINDLFNMLGTDRGRPLAHITHKLGATDLLAGAHQVLRTLVPIESEILSNDGGWYIMRLLPYRTPDDRIDGVVITFIDIAERKRTEAILRASEERQAYLLKLSDALRPLADPVAIQDVAARLLGQQLGASRVLYGELTDDGLEQVIERNYIAAGQRLLTGHFRVAEFGAPLVATLTAGQTVSLPNIANAPALSAAERAAYAAQGIAALISVPLVKSGRFVANLTVHQATPRSWTANELGLIEETAERTWATVERARAEAVLADDLQSMRLLRDLGARLTTEGDIQVLYQEVITAAITLLHADAGTVQILDKATQELVLLAAVGFTPTMMEHFHRVAASSNTSCGNALATNTRTFVDYDVPPSEDPDGSLRRHVEAGYLSAQSTPLITRAGHPIGMVSTHWRTPHRPSERELYFLDLLARQAADLIGQHQVAAALHQSEERLGLLIESATDYAIFATDIERRIISWNSGAQAIFGYTAGEVIGQLADILFTPEDRTNGAPAHEAETALATGHAVDERWHIRKDGSRFYASGVLTLLRASELRGFVKIARDLTESQQAAAERERLLAALAQEQAELQKLNATLEQRVEERTKDLAEKNQELDRFAYLAAHDLKEPLRGIEHLAEWIAEATTDQLPPETQTHLDKLRQRARRITQLVDDLLVYARIGRANYNVEVVDLVALIRNVVDLREPSSGYTVTINEPMPRLVTVRIPLETIFLNLIDNAIKHHHQPETCQIVISAEEQSDWIEFAVSDNGPGIDPEQQARIFELFRSLHPRDEIEGSGMGLPIVQRILERYGGAIRVESNPTAGVTFRFTWPREI